MGRCALCSKIGEDLTLFGINHTDRGHIVVCLVGDKCQENCIVAGSSSSGKAYGRSR